MNKLEFINALQEQLVGLPYDDLEERIIFYTEMIEDKIEDGFSEEEAISQIGSVEEIAEQIIAETPLSSLVKKKLKSKREISWWVLVLIILGSPVWLSLLISILAVLSALYVSLWAVVISLWAVFISLIACGVCGIITGIGWAVTGTFEVGFFLIGAGLLCGGLSIFLFFGCRGATKGTLLLAKAFFLWIKKLFMKKEVG